MTTTILIIINVFAALSIIVLALMQQSKGDMGS
ncbi:MAG: preprotein translocase subunit SecG, partial [Arenicella sp.]